MAKAIAYVVLDGVGDRPVPEFGNRTPLEAAETPNLDRLAARGTMGLVFTVGRGIAPESDAGVFSLLSYDPFKIDLSRGAVEAIGAGIDYRDGDLALRCNFATAQNGQVMDRRAGRNVSTREARELTEAVNNDPALKALAKFELKATIGHRCALVFHADGKRFSSSISNLDPAYARRGKVTIAKSGVKLPTQIPKCVGLNRTRNAIQTARLLNDFADRIHRVLRAHPVNIMREQRGDMPANFLLMRDAGTTIPRVRTLREKFGLSSIALADMPVELGIAKVIGMDTEIFPPDRTREGYSQRVKKAIELAERYDLVYVHLKGPDEPGHDGDFKGKMKSIKDIDSGFFSEIGALEPKLVCVTADHSTPCAAKGHTDDPVPLLIAGPNVDPDGSVRFTESCAKKGELGTIEHGHEILAMLTKM
jgi:2,3-bisphosphoglycerate-independent phosphoglycerate mutase